LHRDIDHAFNALETEEDFIDKQQFKAMLTELGYIGQEAIVTPRSQSNA